MGDDGANTVIQIMERWNSTLDDIEKTFKNIDNQMTDLKKNMEEKDIKEICGECNHG